MGLLAEIKKLKPVLAKSIDKDNYELIVSEIKNVQKTCLTTIKDIFGSISNEEFRPHCYDTTINWNKHLYVPLEHVKDLLHKVKNQSLVEEAMDYANSTAAPVAKIGWLATSMYHPGLITIDNTLFVSKKDMRSPKIKTTLVKLMQNYEEIYNAL